MQQRIGSPEVALSDGHVIRGDLGISGNVMWIWIRDEDDPLNSLMALSEVLSQEEATREITFFFGKEYVTYTGFTKLTAVKVYDGIHVGARLERSGNVHD